MKQEITIWQPSKKKMKHEYPELNKIEEFKDLKDYQLKFCWYYVNPTSPLVRESKIDPSITLEKRRKKAVEVALQGQNENIFNAYRDGKWGEEIEEALKRMASTKVRDRVVARRLFNQAYKNMEAIIGMDEDSVRALNMTEKKSYMSMSLEFMKSMDDIIEKREQAYGVKLKAKKDDKETQDISIERIIKNSQE